MVVFGWQQRWFAFAIDDHPMVSFPLLLIAVVVVVLADLLFFAFSIVR